MASNQVSIKAVRSEFAKKAKLAKSRPNAGKTPTIFAQDGDDFIGLFTQELPREQISFAPDDWKMISRARDFAQAVLVSFQDDLGGSVNGILLVMDRVENDPRPAAYFMGGKWNGKTFEVKTGKESDAREYVARLALRVVRNGDDHKPFAFGKEQVEYSYFAE